MTQLANAQVCLSEPLLRLAAEIAPCWGVGTEDLLSSDHGAHKRARRAWYLVCVERFGWTYCEGARVFHRDATTFEQNLNRARTERENERFSWPWGAMYQAGITGWIRELAHD